MNSSPRPHSPAAARNAAPILEALRPRLAGVRELLEIGSGTGQHAVHFARALPGLRWQASDRAANLPGIRAWLSDAALPNTPPPVALDVTQADWPGSGAEDGRFDAVFSANTLHIMAWPEVQALFAALPRVTAAGAVLAIYGPFNVDGHFTSDSNRDFDASLRAQAPHMGLRDRADVDALARQAGFVELQDIAMPANNRLLVWRRGFVGACLPST